METKKLTQAAMLSALFVVCSITIMGTGIGYAFYLDMIVPVFISLIYLKCDYKFTLLSASTSLLITILVIGDVASGIWMIQSMLLGLVCGILIVKDTTIMDDIFCSAIFACFIMVLIDIYFSGLLGYSFLKDFQVYVDKVPLDGNLKQVIFYCLVAALPVGTIIFTYVASILLGNKLGLLNQYADFKFNILRNFKSYYSYLCCSKKNINKGIIFIVIMMILGRVNFKVNHVYLKAILISIQYIVLFTVIKDSFVFIRRYVYMKTKSGLLDLGITFGVLYLLVKKFSITTIIMIICNLIINKKSFMREKQIDYINYCVDAMS